MRIHGGRIPRAQVIFGLADGMTTGIGLVLGMTITHQSAAAVWAAGLSGGLAAFPGMTSGQYQSAPEDGRTAALACGLATAAGSILVALPYRLAHGTAALAASVIIAAVLCGLVAWLRPESGWRAWALSYGITAVAAGLCLAGGLIPA